MITLILKLILLTSIWVFGVKILTHEGMGLAKLGVWAESKVEEGKIYFEPLLVCEWCMPSVHFIFFVMPISYFVGFLDGYLTFENLLMIPFVVAGASFASGIIWNLALIVVKIYGVLDKIEQLKHFDIKDRKQEFYIKNKINGIHT